MGKEGGYLPYIFKRCKYLFKLPISTLAQENRASNICVTVHELRNNRNFSSKLEEEVEK